MISLTKNKNMLGYELLSSYSNISHFVTTRQGGYSERAYGSFNCATYTDDNKEIVERNVEILIKGMQSPPKKLICPFQVHGFASLVMDDTYLKLPLNMQKRLLYSVDAVITTIPGYCLCIATADCVPILLYDKTHQVVAAVHAGWRGTVEYIVTRTLLQMKQLYSTQGEDVIACIGPSISFESFEVSGDVYKEFKFNGFDMSRISARIKGTRKYNIDLWEANRMQLLSFGVPSEQIEMAGLCTYIHHETFFSARRLGYRSGRNLSGIMLNVPQRRHK